MNLHLAQFSVGRERSHIHRLHLRNVIFLYSPHVFIANICQTQQKLQNI